MQYTLVALALLASSGSASAAAVEGSPQVRQHPILPSNNLSISETRCP